MFLDFCIYFISVKPANRRAVYQRYNGAAKDKVRKLLVKEYAYDLPFELKIMKDGHDHFSTNRGLSLSKLYMRDIKSRNDIDDLIKEKSESSIYKETLEREKEKKITFERNKRMNDMDKKG